MLALGGDIFETLQLKGKRRKKKMNAEWEKIKSAFAISVQTNPIKLLLWKLGE